MKIFRLFWALIGEINPTSKKSLKRCFKVSFKVFRNHWEQEDWSKIYLA